MKINDNNNADIIIEVNVKAQKLAVVVSSKPDGIRIGEVTLNFKVDKYAIYDMEVYY